MSKSASRRLSGRTAVITGAASGIGRALAQRLSNAGCPVALADVDRCGLKETQASLNRAAMATVLDVGDATAVRDFSDNVRDWAPAPIGAVFNNAGVTVASTVLNGSVDDDNWLWNINFHGVVNGTRAFLPVLVEQNQGVIVNTSSVFGLAAAPAVSAYCASKFAIRGFTESLRHELRDTGVTAINVHPGGIDTNLVRNGRINTDPEGLGRNKDQLVTEFARLAMTKPDKAARIIHRGVEAGKARILIGLDARFIDLITRIAPSRYYDVMNALQSWVGPRS